MRAHASIVAPEVCICKAFTSTHSYLANPEVIHSVSRTALPQGATYDPAKDGGDDKQSHNFD
jgi:hypothetical protein